MCQTTAKDCVTQRRNVRSAATNITIFHVAKVCSDTNSKRIVRKDCKRKEEKKTTRNEKLRQQFFFLDRRVLNSEFKNEPMNKNKPNL